MGDLHVVIVNDICEVVCRSSVTLEKDNAFNSSSLWQCLFGFERDFAIDKIRPAGSLVGLAEANGVFLSAGSLC